MNLWDSLRPVVQLLDARGVPYMVIGGLANLHWGEPRSTRDIDLTIAAPDEEIVGIAQALGTILVHEAVDFLQRSRVIPVQLPDGTRLDLIAATISFEHDAIHRAPSITIDDITIRICGPEDLIVHKLVSRRARDLEDVEGILRRRRATLDMGLLRRMVETLSAEAEDPSIRERFERAVQHVES